MAVGAPNTLRDLDSLQKAGKRSSYFDCSLLQKRKLGGEVSRVDLAKSLQRLMANRKSNQKLDVMTIKADGDKEIKILYLVDRSSNPIERRLFRPGLLNKLASQRAKEYIADSIGIKYPESKTASRQAADIGNNLRLLLDKEKRREEKKHEKATDPRRKIKLDIKRVEVSSANISFASGGVYNISGQSGGFSAASNEIKLVTDERGKKFVLKKIPRGLRAENELKLLHKLGHTKSCMKNVIHMHDAGKDDKYFYCVMDYMDGPDCSKLVEKIERREQEDLAGASGRGFRFSHDQSMIEGRRARIVQRNLGLKSHLIRKVAKSLKALADQGIVHNDSKLENVLYDTEQGCQIADFELAKMMGEKVFEGVRLRDNPRFKAPEILKAERSKLDWGNLVEFQLTTKADVWSLGIVVCELMLGMNPFDCGDTSFASEIEDNILNYAGDLKREIFDSLPPELRHACMSLLSRMLHVNPQQRPSIDEILKDSFFARCKEYNDGRSSSEMDGMLAAISTGRSWAAAVTKQRKLEQSNNFQSTTKKFVVIGRR